MMLADLGPGDEAIMPSFAYPTMATAVVRQGATPVFVDVDPHTLNLDPAEVAEGGRPANQGDRRRALRRRRLRDGRAARDRRAWRPHRDRGRGALPPRQLPRPPAGHARRPRHLQLPPHQERQQRRGRRPPGQRPGAAGAGRGRLGEGHRSQALRARRGRSLHLGRHRLLVRGQRAHRRLPLGSAGGGRGDHPAPPGDLEPLPRGVRRARGRGPGAAAGGAATDTLTTAISTT